MQNDAEEAAAALPETNVQYVSGQRSSAVLQISAFDAAVKS